MIAAVLLIAIIANGFIIINLSPKQFYKLHRYDGQLLYIKATFLGIISTSISFILDSYLGITNNISILLNYICKFLPKNGVTILPEAENLKEYLIFFLFTLLVSFLYCQCVRFRLIFRAWRLFNKVKIKSSYEDLAKILLMHTILKDSPLDELLFSSYVGNIYLLITMSDRKVYVGRVISLGEPNEKQGPDQEISIVPVFSGYRDKDTLSVNLNNSYSNNDDTKDIYLILKQDNIVSACEFVESLYEKFSEKNIEAKL